MCQITESGHSRHMPPKISNKETHFLKKLSMFLFFNRFGQIHNLYKVLK